MIPWDVVTPTVRDLVSDLAAEPLVGANGQPVKHAEWADRAEAGKHTGTRPKVLLSVFSIRAVGEDETRYIEVSDEQATEQYPAGLYSYQVGNREITFTVRVESQSQADASWAWQVTERIRSRLRRPSSIERLAAANLSFVRANPTARVPQIGNQRAWSVATFDLVLGYRFQDFDPEWVHVIEQIGLTARLRELDDSIITQTQLIPESV